MKRNLSEILSEARSESEEQAAAVDNIVAPISLLCGQFCEAYAKLSEFLILHKAILDNMRRSKRVVPLLFDSERNVEVDFNRVVTTVENCRAFSSAWASGCYQDDDLRTTLFVNLLLCEGHVKVAANTFESYYRTLPGNTMETLWTTIPGSLKQIFTLAGAASSSSAHGSSAAQQDKNDENQRPKKKL